MRSMLVALALGATLPAAPVVQAQVDPRAPLGQLISAFQTCGPPQTYQMLSPQLFQIVAMQTGGRGCYPDIASAGPVTGMQLVAQQRLPLGSVSIVRVSHMSTQADWFIGINEMTRQIELLTFQTVNGPPPRIETGPNPAGGANPPQPSPRSTPPPIGGNSDGCELYPAMC